MTTTAIVARRALTAHRPLPVPRTDAPHSWEIAAPARAAKCKSLSFCIGRSLNPQPAAPHDRQTASANHETVTSLHAPNAAAQERTVILQFTP
jgi:hypothetical protein